jgi:hypothetical protein
MFGYDPRGCRPFELLNELPPLVALTISERLAAHSGFSRVNDDLPATPTGVLRNETNDCLCGH